MVLKWDTALRHSRRLAGHQQTGQLCGTRACMSERAVLLMEILEELQMLILVSRTCAARCWRRLDYRVTKQAWCVIVALMRIVVLGLNNFGPIHYRIMWHNGGYLWLE